MVAIVFTGTIGALPVPEGGYEDFREPDATINDYLITPVTAFGSIGASLLTLCIVGLSGTQWGPYLMRPYTFSGLSAAYIIAGSSLLFVIIFSLVCLSNLLTGMFVSALMQSTKRDKACVDHESLSTGESSLKKLQDFYTEMDSNMDGMLSWPEFHNGLQLKEDLLAKMGIGLEKAEILFNQLDLNASGFVSTDEFLAGLIKMTRKAKSLDMISIDYQQRKIFEDLMKVKEGFARDVRHSNRFLHEVEYRLGTLTKVACSFSQSWKQNETRVPPSSPLQGTALDGGLLQGAIAQDRKEFHKENVLCEMDTRFGFKKRCDELEAKLKRISERGSTELHGSRRVGAAWRPMLIDDIMPWLRDEMDKFPKRAHPSYTMDASSEGAVRAWMAGVEGST